ncbi:MAG: type II secretion system protein [Gemmataceae bacterium]
MTRDRKRGRAGFTLVELLVVIAIIAVLVGLLLPAVMRALIQGPTATARHDINQLATAIATFKEEFKVKYMPSRFVLHETLSNYNLDSSGNPASLPQPAGVTANDLTRSRRFLTEMFGRRLGLTVNWDQSTTVPMIETVASRGHLLTGEQCLVFFLGGAQNLAPPYECKGFSSSPSDPMQMGGTRRGPFYDFKPGRLVPENGFLVFKDAFSSSGSNYSPSVYFADRSQNDYESHTAKTNVGVFMVAAGRPMNPGGFQIICAGENQVFGRPADYTPLKGSSSREGDDDLANFQKNRLGAPQE